LKILTKYVLKEHLSPLLFSLSALTSLLLLNYVAKRLSELVGKGLEMGVIAEFLLLSVPFTVAMTLPMAVLVATLHAFSRMAAENEITAFKASGLSLQRLMVPVIIAAGGLTVFMVWFNDQVLPASNHRLTVLSNDIARVKPTFALKEQIINEVIPQRLFLRSMHLNTTTNKLTDVTIYDLSNPQVKRTIRADSGYLALTGDRRDLLLTLFDGSMTELKSLEPGRVQRVFFHTDRVKVQGIGNSLDRSDNAGAVKSDREMTVCELQRKVRQSKEFRDSSWQALKGLDGTMARQLTPKPVPRGMGDAYCSMLYRLTDALSVKAAQAAVVPQGQGAATDTSKLPPQAPVVAPSSGIMPAASLDAAQRNVLAETMKVQLTQSQMVIDGNQVEIEKKFAIAFACVIFSLLGAPIALRFPRGGVGMTIGVSLGVFGLYYVGLIVGESLARRGIASPFLSMWAANFILLAVGSVLTYRLGTEGSTSRGSEASEFLTRLRDRTAALFGRTPKVA
jgi:lipopolysaccharide export system permease protein